MEHQIKENWIINNQNVFGLPQEINLSISSIQFEIMNQLSDRSINSISDYLGAEIDIQKEIQFTHSLTIQKIFNEYLILQNINPLNTKTFSCSMVMRYLQISLFKEYAKENNKNILPFSEYKNQYHSLLKEFLQTNVDTDEKDFIKTELITCDKLINELEKPVYNEINIFNEVLDNAVEFKKNLINSLDKRKNYLNQKGSDNITPKIKALFQFIDFLYSNVDNFKQFDEVINDLNSLGNQRSKLNPQKNYKDKLEHEKIQTSISDKFRIIEENIIKPLELKTNELKICDWNKTETLWNWNISDIALLKENFNSDDLSEIFDYKNRYLQFRFQTNNDYFQNHFFHDLDQILKELFDYFKDNNTNEFEKFETPVFNTKSITEVTESLSKGYTKVSFPTRNIIDRINSNFTNDKINPQQQYNLKICSELIGLTGKQNSPNTIQPVTHYIKDVLNKYSLSPAKAKQIVLDNLGAYSPKWNENVIPTIIIYLDSTSENRDVLTVHDPSILFEEIKINGFPESTSKLYNQIQAITENFDKVKLQLLQDDLKYKLEEYEILKDIDVNNEEDQNWIENILERFTNLNLFINDIILTRDENIDEINNDKPQDYLSSYYSESKPLFPFTELDLIPTYFDSKLKSYLSNRKNLLGSAFVEQSEIEMFKSDEIQECDNVIQYYSELFKSRPETLKRHSAILGKQAYKIWLESPNSIYLNRLQNEKTESLQHKPNTEKPEFTINQIALKYVYSEIQITRVNSDEIIKNYGHNSGEKLFQQYTYFRSTSNRKAKPQPCTPKKLRNKIDLLESIIPLVPSEKQQRIRDEILILKNIEEAEFN